jgi:hypothetical protein
VSEPVRTDAGYELIKVMSHEPVGGHSLATIYTNVGVDVAREKSNAAARRTADSLTRVCRTPATLRAAAKKLKLEIVPFHYSIGDTRVTRDMKPVLDELMKLKVGELYPGTFEVLGGGGTCLAFIDSLTPPKKPEWYQAENRALDAYNAGAGRRALEGKRVELDSLLRAGWTLDSLGTLWGGLTEYVHAHGAAGLPGLGGGALLDSLLLGTESQPAVLAPGQVSPWLEVPDGQFKLRFIGRQEPTAAQLSSRVENDRRTTYERKLFAWYDGLKGRYHVKILDPALAAIPLPEPPGTTH